MSEAHLTYPVEKAIPPVVSIGMPVYNGEKYIREALDSLLAQTFTDFELIVSDNASTDETEKVCQEYAARDSRIQYVKQSDNRGALANFQFVLDAARGEYFMWAAADDIWDSRWISGMLDTIKKTRSKAAFGIIQCINEHSEELNHYANNSTFNYRGTPLIRQLKYFLQFEGAGKANPIYSLWKTSGLRRIKFDKYEYDYLLVFDLLKKNDIAECRSSRIYKRIHSYCGGGGISTRAEKGVLGAVNSMINNLLKPFPDRLITGYFRSAGCNKALFIVVTPIKYLIAYWFLFSNKVLPR